MIDLSGARVGDKFLLRGDQIAQIIAINDTQVVMSNDEGFYLNARSNGRSVEFSEFDIFSKIDSRQWLKDMPDASVFKDEFKWLACDKDGGWYVYRSKPALNHDNWDSVVDYTGFYALKTPELTGEQWKDSLISIDELREWQEVNK